MLISEHNRAILHIPMYIAARYICSNQRGKTIERNKNKNRERKEGKVLADTVQESRRDMLVVHCIVQFNESQLLCVDSYTLALC